MGEEALRFLVDSLRSLGVEHLVEFGSGISTAYLASELPGVTILSIEHNPHCYQNTAELLEDYASRNHVRLELRELCWQRHGLGLYQSYRPGDFFPQVDAVIVDGPPGWTDRGREACLYQIFGALRMGGHVYLDDFGRPEEQQIVRNWLSSYPGVFRSRKVAVGHGLCALEKVGNARRARRLQPALMYDNWRVNAARIWNTLKARTRAEAAA